MSLVLHHARTRFEHALRVPLVLAFSALGGGAVLMILRGAATLALSEGLADIAFVVLIPLFVAVAQMFVREGRVDGQPGASPVLPLTVRQRAVAEAAACMAVSLLGAAVLVASGFALAALGGQGVVSMYEGQELRDVASALTTALLGAALAVPLMLSVGLSVVRWRELVLFAGLPYLAAEVLAGALGWLDTPAGIVAVGLGLGLVALGPGAVLGSVAVPEWRSAASAPLAHRAGLDGPRRLLVDLAGGLPRAMAWGAAMGLLGGLFPLLFIEGGLDGRDMAFLSVAAMLFAMGAHMKPLHLELSTRGPSPVATPVGPGLRLALLRLPVRSTAVARALFVHSALSFAIGAALLWVASRLLFGPPDLNAVDLRALVLFPLGGMGIYQVMIFGGPRESWFFLAVDLVAVLSLVVAPTAVGALLCGALFLVSMRWMFIERYA